MNRNEQFDPGSVSSVAVRLTWASLDLMGDDVPQLRVTAAGSPRETDGLRITLKDGRLQVTQAQSLPVPKEPCWLQVLVRVPRNWKGTLTASTGSGMMNARCLSGSDVSLRTGSADLRCSRITAITLALRSGSGDLQADAVAADRMTLRTLSGSMTVTGASAQKYRVSTLTGDIQLVPGPFEVIEGTAGSGKVRLWTPTREYDARLRSLSGRLRTHEVNITEEGPEIHVTTLSGNLELMYEAPEDM